MRVKPKTENGANGIKDAAKDHHKSKLRGGKGGGKRRVALAERLKRTVRVVFTLFGHWWVLRWRSKPSVGNHLFVLF
jgi:hypothetical protein